LYCSLRLLDLQNMHQNYSLELFDDIHVTIVSKDNYINKVVQFEIGVSHYRVNLTHSAIMLAVSGDVWKRLFAIRYFW
jgi:hypothetical protein